MQQQSRLNNFVAAAAAGLLFSACGAGEELNAPTESTRQGLGEELLTPAPNDVGTAQSATSTQARSTRPTRFSCRSAATAAPA